MSPPAPPSSAIPRHAAALALFLLLAWLLYTPPLHQQGAYFGVGSDPLIYIWFLHWWPYALAHHLSPFFTGFVDAPVGRSLAWCTSIPTLALLAAPITAAFGAFAAYNTLMLTAGALAGWVAYLAAFELAGSWPASVAGGLIFGFSAYQLGQQLGHLNLSFTALLPLGLWLGVASARRGWRPFWPGLALGLLLALQFGVSQEVFASACLFGSLLIVILYAVLPGRRGELVRLLPGLAVAAAVCLLLTAPLLWQMLREYGAARQDFQLPADFSADLLSFVIPTPVTALGGDGLAWLTARFPGNFSEEGSYLGLPLLALLAVLALGWRQWPAAMHAALLFILAAALLSLGPVLHVAGRAVAPAPWRLVSWLPLVDAMLPSRFSLYVWLGLAVLVPLWLARPGRRHWRYLALLPCLIALWPSRGFDRHWSTLHVPSVLAGGTVPRGGSLLVLPYFGYEMGYQEQSGMAFRLMGQGYLGAVGQLPFSQWPLFPDLLQDRYAGIDPAAFATFLAAYRTQFVLVTASALPDPAAAALLRAAGWHPTSSAPDGVLYAPGKAAAAPPSEAALARYQPVPQPPSPAVLAAAAAAHQAKLLRMETHRVCQIRTLAARLGIGPAPYLHLYAWKIHPPLPVAAVRCPR